MPTPSSTTEFLDLIRQSEILPADQLTSALDELEELPQDPMRLAAVLVKRGAITNFQAKLLLAGKYRGFKIGSYLIRDQIGQGGMGAVYLAEHETLRRRVALKVLTKADAAGKAMVERFLREARAAAALDHPNIVRLFDVGKQADLHFLVMEYVEGQTLEQMLGRGPVPCGRAAEYIAQAAAGLQHAHEKGFVHRDIKPANLILSKNGTVKLLDMGLARSFDPSDKLTELLDQGVILGTADYISPEQAINSPHVDIRADIYSLGATFFALVTGRPPFEGNTTQKLLQHQMKDPPSLTTLDKTFPKGLAEVVGKMMAKRPEKRYQTPAEVISALAPWVTSTAQVVAGLSGTELIRPGASSADGLDATLSDLVSGGTMRMTGRLPTGMSRRTLTAVAGGAAAGVILLVGGLVWALSGGDKKNETTNSRPPVAGGPQGGPNPATRPVQTSQRPRPKNPTTAEPVRASRPARGAVVFKLDAAKIPACRFTVRGQTLASGQMPEFPPGCRFHCWKPGTVGEFARETIDGRPAFGLANREGEPSAQFAIDLTGEAKANLAPDGEYAYRVEYMTRGGASGNVYVQDQKRNWEVLGNGELADTGGAWKVETGTFRRFEDNPVQFAINANPTADGMLYIRSIEVSDPNAAPAGEVLYKANFAGLQPDTETVRGKTNYGDKVGSQTLPNGVILNHYNNAADADYLIADIGGVRALGLRNVNGTHGTQIMIHMKEVFDRIGPGETATFRITYRCDGPGAGFMAVQLDKDPWTKAEGVELKSAGGAWKTAELRFTRPDTEPYAVIVNVPAAGTLWVRSIEGGLDGAPGGAERSVYRLDLSGQKPFSKRGGREPNPGQPIDLKFVETAHRGDADLPAGWFGGPWSENSESEFFAEEFGGSKVIGMRNVVGKASGMLFTPAFDLPSGRAKVRFEYMTDGGSDSVFKFKPTKPEIVRAWEIDNKVPGTNGQWATKEYEVDLKGATGGYFELHHTDGDPGAAFRLRALEVTEPGAGDVAAAEPPAVYALDLKDVRPFKATVRNRNAEGGDLSALQAAGLFAHCWKNESVTEFQVVEVGGRKAVGVTNLNDDVSSQLLFGANFDPRLKLEGGHQYKMRVEYRTTGDAYGSMMARGKDYVSYAQAELPSTGGQWKRVELAFRQATDAPGDLMIENRSVGAGNTLFIREFAVGDAEEKQSNVGKPSPPPPPSARAEVRTVFAVDTQSVQPFRFTYQDGKAVGVDPGALFPAGVLGLCWKKDSVAEFRAETAGGSVAVGVTNLNDAPSAQILFALDSASNPPLEAGKEYKVRIEYRTANDAAGQLLIRNPAYATLTKLELPSTGGQWRTAEVTFRRPADVSAHAVLENTAVGEGNTLYFRKLVVAELK